MEWQAYLEFNAPYQEWRLFLVSQRDGWRKSYRLVEEEWTPGRELDPTARGQDYEMRGLMQALVNAAPKIGVTAGDSTELAATRRHLEDMREIAKFAVGMEKK